MECEILASAGATRKVENAANHRLVGRLRESMIPDESTESTLEGKLLLASPSLVESTFHRTVILLCSHSRTSGALGFILNRPLGRTVEEVLPDEEFERIWGVPVFTGGPVGMGHLTFAALGWNEETGRLDYETHLSAAGAIRQFEEGFCLRAFVGYSGWSPGQLENEMRQNAWEVKAPKPEVVQGGDLNERLWTQLIRDISPFHRLEADVPDDLSLN
jgi:putative transcriptional regulator